MRRCLLPLLLLGLVPAPARAQLDLPSRPVSRPAPGRPLELPSLPRGDLAPKPGAQGEAAKLPGGGLELPDDPRRAPAPGAAPAATEPDDPSGALSAAAAFILAEVHKARSIDERVVDQAVASLRNLGASAVAAARPALSLDHPPTLLVAARVLLAGGSEADADLVLQRLFGRLPNGACAPLVQALSEVDPVRAPPALFAQLLAHPQAAVRAAAQEHLSRVEPAVLVVILPPVLAARSSDTRLRAVQLLAADPDPRALELLLECLDDPSAQVARRVVDALAARSDERIEKELLRRAFDGRWILRENAYALLALVEREDLRLESLLTPLHADALLGGLASSDAFVSGTCAAALAGIGFRSPASAATDWLERDVPLRLVRAVAGVEFHNDFSALNDVALRRLALISGERFGTDGPAWVAWWTRSGKDFRALRAVLRADPEQASLLRVEFLSTLEGLEAFRLAGCSRDDLAQGSGAGQLLYLSEAQASALYEVLRREGVFGSERLPGTRGAESAAARSLEVEIGGQSKVFRYRGGASEPWFERVVASLRALVHSNRWQLYPEPGLEASPRDAFLAEGEWWDGERSERERDLRLKQRILRALYARPVSERDSGVQELERLAAREGCLEPGDFEALLALLVQERFLGPRALSLFALTLELSRSDAALVDALASTFGPAAAPQIGQALERRGREAVRAAASDERPLLRAVAAALLSRDPTPEEVELLLALLSDPVEEVEIAALLAVGEGRVQAARTEVLVRARVGAPPVRSAALVAAGWLGGEHALDVLILGLSDRDSPEVALCAARGLARLADPSTAPLLVSLLARGGDDPLVEPARLGLLALGERAWPDLLRAIEAPSGGARRDAALLLARQGVPQAVPALVRVLSETPLDERVASELAVLTCVDLRTEREPAASWWSWWRDVVHDDSLAWLAAALEREGLASCAPAAIAGAGSAEGAAVLLGAIEAAPAQVSERARRELSRLIGRELAPPPSGAAERERWRTELASEIERRDG